MVASPDVETVVPAPSPPRRVSATLSRKALLEQPVTGREEPFRDGELIVSCTDLRGIITYINEYFCEISGYHENELIGCQHNVIRHPDMPAGAFADLWTHIQAGRPWVGLVKNRCKNGDHYWVEAHVTPILDEAGKVTGYMSVRRKPSRAQVAEAERVYAQLRTGQLKDVVIRNGRVRQVPLAERLNPLWKLSLTTRLYLFALFGPVLAALLLLRAGAHDVTGWLLVVASLGFTLYSARWLSRDVVGRCNDARRALREIAGDVFTGHIDTSRSDEVGGILQGIKSMQTRLGFQVEDLRRERAMTREAMASATANIMVADSNRKVVFANRAMQAMLGRAEAAIAQTLPEFRAERTVGTYLEEFHPEPARRRVLLGGLTTVHAETVELGALTFDTTVTAVRSEQGKVLGYITEWRDRTGELLIEREIEQVVARAAAGDLDCRIVEQGKQDFHLTISRSVNAMVDNTQRALVDIRQVLHSLAEGDLTHRVDARLQGTFGEMAANANETVERLTEMVGQIKDAVVAINAAASEISSGNDDLSRRTELQAASLEETASSMEELTSTVQHNAERVRDARRLAEQASTIAQDGGKVATEAVSTMRRITDASHRIEEIIGVIDGIAFQTNILALNAAVEAARAGEQGRGFAVVAGEVRALAQRSATSAKEIKMLIETSVLAVDQGSVQVRQAGEAIGKLVSEVGKVSRLVAEISSANDEQTSGIGVVNQAVTELDNSTQQNAALVEQASAAARSMADQAQALSEQMSRFRLVA